MEKNHSSFITMPLRAQKFALTALIILGGFVTAYADSTLPAPKVKEITVTAIGITDGAMMFNVELDNANGDKVTIALVDETGGRLYRETLTDKVIRKTFKTPADLGTLVLVVTNANDKSQKKFEITTKQRTYEEVTINSVH